MKYNGFFLYFIIDSKLGGSDGHKTNRTIPVFFREELIWHGHAGDCSPPCPLLFDTKINKKIDYIVGKISFLAHFCPKRG